MATVAHKRHRQRSAGDGGGSPESRWSLLENELPAIFWDAAGLYAELGRRRTRLEDQGVARVAKRTLRPVRRAAQGRRAAARATTQEQGENEWEKGCSPHEDESVKVWVVEMERRRRSRRRCSGDGELWVAQSGERRKGPEHRILVRAEREAREDARRPRRCSPATGSAGWPAMAQRRIRGWRRVWR
jgi:hypothetical protein